MDKDKIVQLLNDIRPETNLYTFFLSSSEFDSSLLKDCIRFSFNQMIASFKNDCMQYNPHINYLKVQPLLKITLIVLEKNLDTLLLNIPSINQYNISQLIQLFTDNNFIKLLKNSMDAVIMLMKYIHIIENVCLIYIETKFIEKFIKENLLKINVYELYIKFATLCLVYGKFLLQNENVNTNRFYISIKCANEILKQKYLWIELNQMDKFAIHMELIFNAIYSITNKLMVNKKFQYTYDIENVFKFKSIDVNVNCVRSYKKAIYIGKFIEISMDGNAALTLINFGNSCRLKVIFFYPPIV